MHTTNRTQNYISLFFTVIIISVLIFGCGPSRLKLRLDKKDCVPSNLTATPNDQSLLLKWDTNCDINTVLSGYNIYILTEPIYDLYGQANPPDEIRPVNIIPYPGDTNPEKSYETMALDMLENGVEYYVSVRTVFPDRSITVSSNEVAVMCRPEGEFTLDFRFSGENDGFIFSSRTGSSADNDKNDIYYFRAGQNDFIASPHRLNGYNRESAFFSLGQTKDIYQYPELSIDNPPIDKMPIKAGESYLIRTADGNYAKLRIEEISGQDRERKVRFKYIYQTIPDLMRF